MTAAEWLACEDPFLMLALLNGKVSERKQRLIAAAFCHVSGRFASSGVGDATGLAERLADGLVTMEDAQAAVDRLIADHVTPCEDGWDVTWGLWNLFSEPAFHAAMISVPVLDRSHDVPPTIATHLLRECAARIRCVLGNPFPCVTPRRVAWLAAAASGLVKILAGSPPLSAAPVPAKESSGATADPSWLTSDVLALARQVYDGREFSLMPILADALQDAGCQDETVLGHCRGNGPHALGCWVVDLLLGKE